LRGGWARDRQLGSTQAGPQRADLRLATEERSARQLVSRGQQKLLACTLILAATRVVQRHLGRPLLLLLDDPAAELDRGSLERLMEEVADLGSQVIATSLQSDVSLFPEAPARFHVEQGRLESID
jgi:DNA replication and repair protein RecF